MTRHKNALMYWANGNFHELNFSNFKFAIQRKEKFYKFVLRLNFDLHPFCHQNSLSPFSQNFYKHYQFCNITICHNLP